MSRLMTCLVALGICAAPTASAATDELTQLLDKEKPSQPLLVEPPAAPEAAPPAAEIDVTGIWFHLRQGRPDRAAADLRRLKAEHPGWQPVAELERAVEAGLARRALETGGTPAPAGLAILRSGLEPCDDPQLAWMLVDRGLLRLDTLTTMGRACDDADIASGSIDRYLERLPEDRRAAEQRRLRGDAPAGAGADVAALGRLSPAQARRASRQRLDRAAEVVRRAKDGGGAVILGWIWLHRGDSSTALTWFGHARAWGAGGAVAAGVAEAWFMRAEAAAQAGHSDAAAQAMAHSIRAGRRDAAETLGWRMLDKERPADALRFFRMAEPTENVAFGRYLALRAVGETAEATTLACTPPVRSERFDQACRGLLVEAMVVASRGERHDEVLRLAERLAAHGGVPPQARSLVAWSRLKSGDAAGAADAFEALLRDGEDSGLANGLVASLAELGAEERLRAAAARYPGVAEVVARRNHGQAFARKQFDLAERLAPGAEPLTGRAAWSVGAAVTARATDGVDGLDRLTALSPRLMAEGMVGELRVGAQLVGTHLSTGMADPTALLGRRFLAADTADPLAESDVVHPVVRARWETQDLTVSGHLATTPILGAVSPLPVGEISVTSYMDPLIVQGWLFAQSVTSSLLSWSGARDPVSGDSWGRVIDTGVGLQGIWTDFDPVSLSLSGEAAWLSGDNVADNHRFALRSDVSYDLKWEDFDYVRVGPFASWASFDRNLSHFTWGHGGYHSPQTDIRVGLLLDALTLEGRQWIVRATASAGYGYTKEDASPLYPLTPEQGGSYEGSSSSGAVMDIMLQGVALVTPQLMVGGFVGASFAPDDTSVAAGLAVQIPFQPRTTVVSADLPAAQGRLSP